MGRDRRPAPDLGRRHAASRLHHAQSTCSKLAICLSSTPSSTPDPSRRVAFVEVPNAVGALLFDPFQIILRQLLPHRLLNAKIPEQVAIEPETLQLPLALAAGITLANKRAAGASRRFTGMMLFSAASIGSQ